MGITLQVLNFVTTKWYMVVIPLCLLAAMALFYVLSRERRRG